MFPFLTVRENLMMGAYPAHRHARGVAAIWSAIYGYFPRLKERLDQPAGQLSGGEQQMLAISAGADEPAEAAAARRAFARPVAAAGEGDFRHHRARQRRAGRVDPAGRAERADGAETADYGYVLEVGRIVMADTCERLMQSKDIQEFYLGARGRQRARRAALEAEEDLAMKVAECRQGDEPRRAERMTRAKEADVADTIPKTLRPRGRALARPAGDPREEHGHLEDGHVGAMVRALESDRLCARRASASSPAMSLRSCATPSPNGSTPTWACCARAASRPASIRPIPREQVEYLINDSATKVLFVEDDEQLDKALECAAAARRSRRSSSSTWRAWRTFSDPMVVSLDAFIDAGRAHIAGREALLDRDGSPRAGSRTWRSSSTRRARRARPRARCTPIAASCSARAMRDALFRVGP